MRLNYLLNDGKLKETRANVIAQWVKAFAVELSSTIGTHTVDKQD